MNKQQELRQQGYDVRVVTRRGLKFDDKKLYTMATIREMGLTSLIDPKRGEVEVRIKAPDGTFSKGVSLCHKHDNFNKKEGLKLAFHRALRNLGLVEAE